MFNSVTQKSYYPKNEKGEYTHYLTIKGENAKSNLLEDMICKELKFSHIKRITKKIVTGKSTNIIFTVYHDNGYKVVYTCEK